MMYQDAQIGHQVISFFQSRSLLRYQNERDNQDLDALPFAASSSMGEIF
jgi:hypothetical protein